MSNNAYEDAVLWCLEVGNCDSVTILKHWMIGAISFTDDHFQVRARIIGGDQIIGERCGTASDAMESFVLKVELAKAAHMIEEAEE